jgi:biotin-[acetyl-CoA-carboxylase] ligase BirA-like protein
VIFDESIDGHRLVVHHLKRSVDSTQDEAKRLLSQDRTALDNKNHFQQHFAVISDAQSSGRGTSGRSWVASPGNLFLTYCLPMDDIHVSKLTLLPLSIGVLVAESLQTHLTNTTTVRTTSIVTVKWPNDVLLDQKKVAGTLIENCRAYDKQYWLLIGVGVNLASHPTNLPAEQGAEMPSRPATCLKEYLLESSAQVPSAVAFGTDLSQQIHELVVQGGELGRLAQTATSGAAATATRTTQPSILHRWQSLARIGETYTIRQTGEEVTTLGVEQDGQLRVIGKDGKERLLVSDYFV